jgi:hypothetical protein
LLACDKRTPPPEPVRAPAAEAADERETKAVPELAADPEAPGVGGPEAEPSAEPSDQARVGFSADGLRAHKAWPFHVWDGARAYAYNLAPYGPDPTLRVYEQAKGWDDSIAVERELTRAQAEEALRMLGSTQGEMLVSGCAYPRHAVVLFSGDVPVGSISVCFECGDILIWPPFDPDPHWPAKKRKLYKRLMPLYDRVFPQWQKLFEQDLGIPTDWKQIEAH